MKQRYCYIVCKKYENFHKFFLKMRGTVGLARDYGRKKRLWQTAGKQRTAASTAFSLFFHAKPAKLASIDRCPLTANR